VGTLSLVYLPPGYRVEWVEDHLRLFDPRGERVATYPAGLASLLTIEEEAWRRVWGEVDRDIRRELKQFSRGTRAVTELHRMRQYVRFLEILAQAAPGAVVADLPRRPSLLRTRWPIRAAKVAAGVGLVAAALLLFLLVPSEPPLTRTADAPLRVPESVARPQPPVQVRAPQRPAPVAAVKPRRTAQIRTAPIRRHLKPIAGYAMAFGKFTSLTAARACAQRVRSKGYAATVVRAGKTFRVVGRTYTTRARAEQMAKNLREINLPASVQPVGL
jgi:hypothetical protein